jgi:hypothetical protein
MSRKKPDSKDSTSIASASSGRISGLKMSRDYCEFELKGTKGGARQFVVNGKSGLQFDIAAKILVAAWESKHKVTVQPMTEAGMENLVASISLGSLRKEPKAAKGKNPAKAVKSAKSEKRAKAVKPVKVVLEEPLAA